MMRDLKTKHRAVARYLALGIPLADVCENLGLSLESWRQIVSEPLFKQEVKRVEGELEEKMLENAVSDPVVAKMKMSALQAVSVLVSEMNNQEKEMGASSATRIRAADSLLDRVGYNTPSVQNGSNIIFLEMSTAKLDALRGKKGVAEQPDSVRGA